MAAGPGTYGAGVAAAARVRKVFGLGPRISYSVTAIQNVKTEIGLHVLAYNMKRVMQILGTGPLMEAMRT